MGGADEGEHEAGPAQGDDPQAGRCGRGDGLGAAFLISAVLPACMCACGSGSRSPTSGLFLDEEVATLPQYYSCWRRYVVNLSKR